MRAGRLPGVVSWLSLGLAALVPAAALTIPGSVAVARADRVIVVDPAVPVDSTVDPRSRASVMASLPRLRRLARVPSAWSGDTGTCRAGDTSADFKQAVLDTVNWYRNMVGAPDAVLVPEYNRQAQEAALMMAAASKLSHAPSRDWPCWTESGSAGAGSSNLFLGPNGPEAVHGYIDDSGTNNTSVGHRWWILRPATRQIGTGDTDRSNALHVTGNAWYTAGPAVGWPSPGYFPAEMLPSSRRWSFFPPDETGEWDLSGAQVVVSGPGGPVATTTIDRSGDRVVWEMPASESIRVPAADTRYEVSVSGAVNGQNDADVATFRYSLVLVPGLPPHTQITAGPANRVSSGSATFRFTPDSDATCRLDTGRWRACWSPKRYTGLEEGSHVFAVRARNEWGWDRTPATLDFTVVKPDPRPRLEVHARAVRKASRIRLDVDPDRAHGSYSVQVHQRGRGRWTTVRTLRTKSSRDQRVINLPAGRYRIVAPAQLGFLAGRSNTVRLAK